MFSIISQFIAISLIFKMNKYRTKWTEGSFKKFSNTRNHRPMNSKAKLQAWDSFIYLFKDEYEI